MSPTTQPGVVTAHSSIQRAAGYGVRHFFTQKKTNGLQRPTLTPSHTKVMIQRNYLPLFVGLVTTKYKSLFDFNRFSNVLRLSRSCAWALRFIHNTLAKTRHQAKQSGELDLQEIEAATNILCRDAQRESYPDEYAALAAGRPVGRHSTIKTLLP